MKARRLTALQIYRLSFKPVSVFVPLFLLIFNISFLGPICCFGCVVSFRCFVKKILRWSEIPCFFGFEHGWKCLSLGAP